MSDFHLSWSGEYDLARAKGFLEGWPPTAGASQSSDSLSWAAHVGGTWQPVATTVRQADHRLIGSYDGDAEAERVAAETARILSLDIDATSLDDIAQRDHIAGDLIRANPGLRPVCFWTPYEALVWGIISQRRSMTSASSIKTNITATLGVRIGQHLAFPAPQHLLELDELPGLNRTTTERLHAGARAALDGALEATTLRRRHAAESIERLQQIPGVGPFTAELILVRGAGHPDVFPRHERRLHAIMRAVYDRPDAHPDELASIADTWRPYRSWVGFLFRSRWANQRRTPKRRRPDLEPSRLA